jgi:hypothetical protein
MFPNLLDDPVGVVCVLQKLCLTFKVTAVLSNHALGAFYEQDDYWRIGPVGADRSTRAGG